MIVRRAELSDIPAAAALERAEFPDGADEGMLARLWETDGGVILAAEEGNDLLGYVWARFVLDEGDIGKIIGRQGRIIKAIRTLARAAASQDGFRVEVELAE